MQDLFGWRDRINVPGTVGDDNWTWRLPWPVDRLRHVPRPSSARAFCRRLAGARARRVGRTHVDAVTGGTQSDRQTRAHDLRHRGDNVPSRRAVPRSANIRCSRARSRSPTSRSSSTSFPSRRPRRRSSQRLDGREFQILMAEAPLPDDASTVVPVSYKVSHELRERGDRSQAGRSRSRGCARSSSSTAGAFCTTGSAPRAWTGAARDTSAR